jgi:hypothetical protein
MTVQEREMWVRFAWGLDTLGPGPKLGCVRVMGGVGLSVARRPGLPSEDKQPAAQRDS